MNRVITRHFYITIIIFPPPPPPPILPPGFFRSFHIPHSHWRTILAEILTLSSCRTILLYPILILMSWPYVLKRSFRFHDWSLYIMSIIKTYYVKSVCMHAHNNSLIAAFMFNKPVICVIVIVIVSMTDSHE